MVENYKQYIVDKSKETGFITSTFEKVDKLLNILEWINENKELRDLLVLKGGTAINTAIFNFPRLSVDLDFDVNVNLPKDEMVEKRKYIKETIYNYLKSQGYVVNEEKSKNVYALDSFAIEYEDIKGNVDNIKVEVNYMLREHILDAKPLDLNTDIFDNKNFKINCVNPIEIYAAKITALLNRTTARDLFDIYTLSKYGLFDGQEKELLKNCFILNYIAICGYDLKDMKLENIETITKQEIKNKLIPALKNRNPKLCDVEDMKTEERKYLEDILELDDRQKLFCEKFKNGIYEPELLFNDSNILNRIKEHPMIMWKLENKI